MQEILECFLKDEDLDMQRQVQFIIKQLNLSSKFKKRHSYATIVINLVLRRFCNLIKFKRDCLKCPPIPERILDVLAISFFVREYISL